MKEKGIWSSLFKLDTPFMRFCEKLGDVVLVNILFVLTCLPLLSQGLAKIALFETMEKVRKERRLSILSLYFTSLKKHWREGLALSAIELFISLICLINILLFAQTPGLLFQIIRLLSVALLILFQLVFLVLYPLASHKVWSLVSLFQTSFLLLSLNFPWFFLLAAIFILMISLALLSGMSLLFTLFFLLMIGVSLWSWLQLAILDKVLARYPNLF